MNAALLVELAARDADSRRVRARLFRQQRKAEPPAKLVDFNQTLDVRRAWSQKVGGSPTRLRLGLRPASDGARVFAGPYDGHVRRSTP